MIRNTRKSLKNIFCLFKSVSFKDKTILSGMTAQDALVLLDFCWFLKERVDYTQNYVAIAIFYLDMFIHFSIAGKSL